MHESDLTIRPVAAPPATMTAVVQTHYGQPADTLHLRQVDRPEPGAGEVLVRVRSTSVNTPDLVAVTGEPRILRLRSGLRRPSVAIRGSDLAGSVSAVGDGVTDLRPGDEVFGSVWNGSAVQAPGTFAEYAVAPATQVIRRPDAVSVEQAAASVMAGLTALIGMRDVAAVGPGTRVLVNGASGGVGTFAVQIATALGAEVTGVCSTRNLDLVRSLGARDVIDYTTSDVLRSDERYDVVLDNVMNHPPAAMARLVAPGGIFVPNSVGTSGGLLGGLPRMARAALLGRRRDLDVRTITYEVHRTNLAELAELLEAGTVTAPIDRSYPLQEAPAAVAHVLRHHARGKVTITGVTA
jgi:NADPH:quinone reductase-like Zn-dependent oxidoreductase